MKTLNSSFSTLNFCTNAIYGTAWDGCVKITATPASQFIIATKK